MEQDVCSGAGRGVVDQDVCSGAGRGVVDQDVYMPPLPAVLIYPEDEVVPPPGGQGGVAGRVVHYWRIVMH